MYKIRGQGCIRTQLWSPPGQRSTPRLPPGLPLHRHLHQWCPTLRWRMSNLSPYLGGERHQQHAAPWPEPSGPKGQEVKGEKPESEVSLSHSLFSQCWNFGHPSSETLAKISHIILSVKKVKEGKAGNRKLLERKSGYRGMPANEKSTREQQSQKMKLEKR